jgi:hypothetical protein
MKGMALLAIAVAAFAVLLVARGGSGVHIHMLVAAALGAGLAVLLAGALMSLLLLGRSSCQDEQAAQFEKEDRS